MKNKKISIIFALSCLFILSANVITASAYIWLEPNPWAGTAPLTVTFTAQMDEERPFYLSFEGKFSTDMIVPNTQDYYYFTHPFSLTYDSPGTYQIRASQYIGGTYKSWDTYITVYARPHSGFTVSPTSGCAPLTVQITDTSTDASTYKYNFGDNSPIETTKSPVHTYRDPGDYTITQVVANPAGTEDTTTVQVKVRAKPTAAFTIDTKSGEVPFTVHVTDHSTGSTGKSSEDDW